jgi:hypothetical protein
VAAVGKRAWEVYRVLISLIALACVVQIYLAGRGVFGIKGSAPIGSQSSFDPHRTLGNIIGVAAIIVFVIALVIWDMNLVVWTLILAVLAEAIQHLTTSPSNPWVAGIHAVTGLGVVAIAGSLAHRAWHSRATAEPPA